jgi:hypothetical protein
MNLNLSRIGCFIHSSGKKMNISYMSIITAATAAAMGIYMPKKR